MDNIKILFGRKIKEIRKEKGYTQSRLAELVNVDDKHISCIESGKNFPSPDLLARLSKAFNMEVKDFFEFNYLKNPKDLKRDLWLMIDSLEPNELILAYKYIKTFLLK